MKAVIIGFSHMHVNEVAQYISECEGFDLVGLAEVPDLAETVPAYRYTAVWNLENVRDNYCRLRPKLSSDPVGASLRPDTFWNFLDIILYVFDGSFNCISGRK